MSPALDTKTGIGGSGAAASISALMIARFMVTDYPVVFSHQIVSPARTMEKIM
jgi:hypothetical protein